MIMFEVNENKIPKAFWMVDVLNVARQSHIKTVAIVTLDPRSGLYQAEIHNHYDSDDSEDSSFSAKDPKTQAKEFKSFATLEKILDDLFAEIASNKMFNGMFRAEHPVKKLVLNSQNVDDIMKEILQSDMFNVKNVGNVAPEKREEAVKEFLEKSEKGEVTQEENELEVSRIRADKELSELAGKYKPAQLREMVERLGVDKLKIKYGNDPVEKFLKKIKYGMDHTVAVAGESSAGAKK